MKIRLLCIGKTDDGFIVEGMEKYQLRLKHYTDFDLEIIPDLKNAKNHEKKARQIAEGNMLLEKVLPGDTVVLLDDKGKQYTSLEFAGDLQKKMNAGPSRILFLVGGAFGFSKEVYDAANDKISLSKLTYSHQLVRLVFSEQLYRAFTILKGEKYHHE